MQAQCLLALSVPFPPLACASHVSSHAVPWRRAEAALTHHPRAVEGGSYTSDMPVWACLPQWSVSKRLPLLLVQLLPHFLAHPRVSSAFAASPGGSQSRLGRGGTAARAAGACSVRARHGEQNPPGSRLRRYTLFLPLSLASDQWCRRWAEDPRVARSAREARRLAGPLSERRDSPLERCYTLERPRRPIGCWRRPAPDSGPGAGASRGSRRVSVSGHPGARSSMVGSDRDEPPVLRRTQR